MTGVGLDRREVLGALFPDPTRYLMVAGLAGSARDAAALTGEADNLFAFGGAMGGAVPMGLGMALAAPDRPVAVITGDGELLMNAGALASVASAMPENLSIVCIDNGRHGETGGQLGHSARRTDLARLAEGAGLPSAMTAADGAGLAAAADFLETAPGPRFVCVRVRPGPPAEYRRSWDPAEGRLRFRRGFDEATGG
ncbi:MAG: thiamine pyrophosphate-dependent enzyme [Defluviicoccus sp.]|nr:thiamine pyrophosphate-dependent enzyme [Defluviicoccus sp.]MDE0385066.1 thiamine pyrophosphate-dependent enzyme [Defluviicoccus sp.]